MVITRAKIAINLFEIRMSVHFGVLEIQHGQWKVEWLEMSVSTLFAQWYTLSRPVLKLRQLPFWNIWNHFSPVLTLRSWQSAGLDNVTKKVYECLDIHLPAYAHTHTHTHMWVNVKTTQCTHVMLEKKLLSRPVFKNALFSAILNCTDAKNFFSLFPNFFPLKKQNFNKIYHMSKFQIY